MNTFFTADTHFGHTNIIEYCNRPFTSSEEMDAKLIENWNKRVQSNDLIYHLGDFCFGHPLPYVQKLNGKKVLIFGNHDHRWKKKLHQCGFELLLEKYEWNIESFNLKLTMTHQRQVIWDCDENHLHLHGHTHFKAQISKHMIDVGVDAWNFSPVSLEEILLHARGSNVKSS